jgi:hypothetical protein
MKKKRSKSKKKRKESKKRITLLHIYSNQHRPYPPSPVSCLPFLNGLAGHQRQLRQILDDSAKRVAMMARGAQATASRRVVSDTPNCDWKAVESHRAEYPPSVQFGAWNGQNRMYQAPETKKIIQRTNFG